MSTPLTEHFVLEEFTRSQTATRRGINNSPSPRIVAALRTLCEHVLEPVRIHYGRPVHISSGYRSPELNAAIGGSSTSQHVKGEAADFYIWGVEHREIVDWIMHNVTFDQVILEFDQWVHASYRARGGNRGMALRAVRDQSGRVRYRRYP